MSLEYRIAMVSKNKDLFLEVQVRARPENPWRTFGFVRQQPAAKAGEELFMLSVHERVSRELHAGVPVTDLETGLNMLLAMWQAHVQQLEAKK